MYIEPKTNIRLLKDVPLDTTYDHTIYFNSATAQYSYFVGLEKYNLTNYTYQRVKKGVARVGIKADSLYDCNYMMFQNTSYGSKWFYAFITAVEFVNNECSEVYFELDVMQTWFFDCSPDMCFVEREHSVTDNIGIHIEPESVNTGEYVFNSYGKLTNVLDPMAVVIMISDSSEAPDGHVYGGVYGGATLKAYNLDDTASIQAELETYAQKPDAVISMYMCPVIAVGTVIPEGGLKIDMSTEPTVLSLGMNAITEEDTLDGYKPKNKKLYTYPYNFPYVSDGRNSNITYRYEFFEGLKPTLKAYVGLSNPVSVQLLPINYKGCGEVPLNEEVISLSDYPLCSWNTDAFKAWLAQNSVPLAGNAIANAALASALSLMNPAMGIGLVGTAALSGGVSLAHSATNALSQGYSASIASDISKGNFANGNLNVARKAQSFFGGRCSITAEYARMIDDYFTMFGYATRRCKIPNRNSRPHWNYVKTLGCTVTGSVPADDMRKICGIYDRGITFWKNGSEVGDYSLDNTV